jgi:hypothetical protein
VNKLSSKRLRSSAYSEGQALTWPFSALGLYRARGGAAPLVRASLAPENSVDLEVLARSRRT